MPLLIALSILAFVALLWATVSLASRRRRVQRRRRREQAAAAAAPRKSIAATSPHREALFYRDPQAPPVPEESPGPSLAETPAAASRNMSFERLAAADAVHFGQAPAARTEAFPALAPDLLLPPPPRLRRFPTRLGKHPVALEAALEVTGKAAGEGVSPWNPFGADFGDLSDPTPSPRRPQARSRSRERSR